MSSHNYNGPFFNSRTLPWIAVLFGLLVALADVQTYGQGRGQSSLYGTVTVVDSRGAVVAGAKVTATNLDTNVSWRSVSNSSGNSI